MSPVAPLTREEIELAQRLEAKHKAGEPRSRADARKIVAKMFADRQAAHDRQRELALREGIEPAGENELPDLMSFIRSVAKEEEVTRPDRGDDRALWSWQSQPAGMDREIKHRFLAQACGETRGYQVLEDTPAAGRMDGYYLGNSFMAEVLTSDYGVSEADLRKTTAEIWPRVSDRYVAAAKGQVLVFAAEIGEGSVLGATELKRVLGPEGVGKENVDFLVDFPHQGHLPADIRDLMVDPAVRCQLRREDHAQGEDKSPASFAGKLAAIDVPEHLKRAHAAAVAKLNAVESYAELAPPQAEITEPELTAPEPRQPGGRLTFQDPELTEPAPDQPASAPTAPAPPTPHVPVPGASFLHGATLPRTLVVPPRPAPAVASTHGVMNPAVEAAPKAPETDL
ncbi:hypothetical protein ACFY7H_05070 [Streptomyces sp. NPDC012794]|uniref:hypothetical protein n=1 Tax=Streptomyces sp. NPDC012794 TaxID=3364850 RepID=UPI0036A8EDFC